MTTPFTPGIPNTGQSLGITKNPIRNNFTALVEDLDQNHVAIGNTGRGKHKFMQMPEQAAAPVTLANEMALYSKEAGGQTALYFKQEADGVNPGGEFGWMFRKGIVNMPARPSGDPVPAPQLVIDFSGFPSCFGYINLRDNLIISDVNDIVYVFYLASTGTILFGGINQVSALAGNSSTATIHFGNRSFRYQITGSQVTISYTSGQFGAAFTANWIFVANIFPES